MGKKNITGNDAICTQSEHCGSHWNRHAIVFIICCFVFGFVHLFSLLLFVLHYMLG